MPALKSKLSFFCQDQTLVEKFKVYEPLYLNQTDLQRPWQIDVLVIECSLLQNENLKIFEQKKHLKEILKIILVFDEKFQSLISINDFNLLQPNSIQTIQSLKSTHFIALDEEISQAAQDESYLYLSTELNSQYESIKFELEQQLIEKTTHLLKSRKHIFEINNRIELLRKALFVTSKIHEPAEAEDQLNHFLTKNGKVTWFKIIPSNDIEKFETDLKEKIPSTFYKANLKIASTLYGVFFIKGDKKSFKKSDVIFFDKIVDNLQINLSRYIYLASLQQSERLLDLAFHSSPHYIIVIDEKYQILQANLAAEKKAVEFKEQNKCYELLFNRTSPCQHCKLGQRFQVQNNNLTYQVQSNHFQISEDSQQKFWIHLYEDISEQKTLESKFEQMARLSELGLISSSIAHELNNPLGGIISYLQLMKMDLPITHPFLSDIELMNQTALRMKKIIEDLLVFSRKEEDLKLEVIALQEIVQKSLSHIQMQLKKENLKVSLQEYEQPITHAASALHLRSTIHFIFQFLIQQLKTKKITRPQLTGLVEVKIFQDQINSYLSFLSNLGPLELQVKTNDISLISLEKNILDQGFRVLFSEPKPDWVQILITLPITKA